MLEFTDTRTFPFIAAAALSEITGDHWETQLECHAGWSVRDLASHFSRPEVQGLLDSADASVIGVGSIDTFTVGLPGGLGLSHRTRPRLQHLELRRIRGITQPLYFKLHAGLIRLTREKIPHTSQRQFARSWRRVLDALAIRSQPSLVFLPVKNRSPLFANSNRFHQTRKEQLEALIGDRGAGRVHPFDTTGIVDQHADHVAPDGLHWDFELHQIIGRRLGAELADRLRGGHIRP